MAEVVDDLEAGRPGRWSSSTPRPPSSRCWTTGRPGGRWRTRAWPCPTWPIPRWPTRSTPWCSGVCSPPIKLGRPSGSGRASASAGSRRWASFPASGSSAYDATYVALAEALGCGLVTADARLAQAPGPTCPITVVRRW